jgi:hypothetical protein
MATAMAGEAAGSAGGSVHSDGGRRQGAGQSDAEQLRIGLFEPHTMISVARTVTGNVKRWRDV